MSLFLLTASLYLMLYWHISLFFIRKLIIKYLLKMRSWGLGSIEVSKVLKGLQIFSMLLLLERADSTPNTHLNATKSLGSFSFRDDTCNSDSFPSKV